MNVTFLINGYCAIHQCKFVKNIYNGFFNPSGFKIQLKSIILNSIETVQWFQEILPAWHQQNTSSSDQYFSLILFLSLRRISVCHFQFRSLLSYFRNLTSVCVCVWSTTAWSMRSHTLCDTRLRRIEPNPINKCSGLISGRGKHNILYLDNVTSLGNRLHSSITKIVKKSQQT